MFLDTLPQAACLFSRWDAGATSQMTPPKPGPAAPACLGYLWPRGVPGRRGQRGPGSSPGLPGASVPPARGQSSGPHDSSSQLCSELSTGRTVLGARTRGTGLRGLGPPLAICDLGQVAPPGPPSWAAMRIRCALTWCPAHRGSGDTGLLPHPKPGAQRGVCPIRGLARGRPTARSPCLALQPSVHTALGPPRLPPWVKACGQHPAHSRALASCLQLQPPESLPPGL